MVFFLHWKEKKKEGGGKKTKIKSWMKPLDDEKHEGELRSKKPMPLLSTLQLLVRGLVWSEGSDC